MIPFVVKLFRENLDNPGTKDLQRERAQQALAPQPPASAHPISILVRFLSFKMKEEMLKLAWQKKGFPRKNTKIVLDHDYTPGVLVKRREYAEIWRVLRENNIKFQTL